MMTPEELLGVVLSSSVLGLGIWLLLVF